MILRISYIYIYRAPRNSHGWELIHAVIMEFVDSIGRVESPEDEDEEIQTFASSCFHETYEQLFYRLEPLDPGVEQALGSANDAFPYLLPKVHNQYREICRRMMARQRAALQQLEAEQQQEDEERNMGNTQIEFTLLLMRTLEDVIKEEMWGTELRNTLQSQLLEFLNQSTSIDPDHLVKEYERFLPQIINAQMQRLRDKWNDDKKTMLKESGPVKRIITRIPEAARETFKDNVYNPNKQLGMENVHDEAEYEEQEGEEGLSLNPLL